MIGRTKGIATLFIALTLPLAACDNGIDPEFGSVSILLTDAPGDEIAEAWVTFTDIYLQGQGGDQDPPGGRVHLLQDGNETHELLSLANEVEELVVGQEVPTGSYGQLRVVLSGACIVTGDGAIYTSSSEYTECGPTQGAGTLQLPSMQQTGIKVLLHGLQVTGGQQVVVLDFDVSQSFGRAAGMSNLWVMTPVIHAADLGLTAGVTATLSAGDVTLPEGHGLGDFSATLTPAEGDDSEVAFELVQDVLRADFRFLMPENGPFEVRLNVPDGLEVTVSPESPQTVNPASGQTAEVNWVIQSAEETESEENVDS